MDLEIILDAHPDLTFLKADGFDDCVLGYSEGFEEPRLIYSVTLILEKLMTRDNMEYHTAVEFFNFNIEGAYVGLQTPIFCYDG